MNTRVIVFGLLCLAPLARAQTTINPVNRHAYGANVGWLDWRTDDANGAVVGDYICLRYVYAANLGWVSLGSGVPANAARYQNNAATNFGVNHDGLGNLRGYAYSATVGWINFEDLGAPKVDLLTGRLSGFIYGANVGWISLSNAVAYVQTDAIAPGTDTDGDGIADAFEFQFTGNLTTMNSTSDLDRDGFTDSEEYLAGTDPTDPSDTLKIVQFITSGRGTNVTVTWSSKPTRQYYIEQRNGFDPGTVWLDSGLGLLLPGGATTSRVLTAETNLFQDYFRIKAVRPLSQ
jgi:hypothetical protein